MTISNSNLRRGEIWLVNFDPTLGAEIKKKRPAVIISSDAINKLPIKLVAPITEWKDKYAQSFWHVQILSDHSNGLSKNSSVDVLQLRGIDNQRFIQKLGSISATLMEEIVAAIAAVIEYQ
ncbi:MAG: type II toxin-antitoxin system PemK/MazF family toxin [Chloroflexi bacterium AL-W]|nr:type II toxin-antitoxin system PemK/MazF family toxin [Chloroflexi bacterium AL-N1]NOK71055.1 type II toxin-antitoxin system PemK/MazF family toxin [Chloroflexi bacterium AL-N10]NOK72723.1 type II toxin-antitoxin system PemK/MazF family toxin [Chloroflexi bacterium AL-N5]NOK79189.1 type II toxin-antitoxin system PemK/MazF family toxin [Chloroflexi bacterium AL-W]NOK87105.1 type II toxin-antitoxin system PemK/MazF family toxin [Chloroflexi bacterium AL-N15]